MSSIGIEDFTELLNLKEGGAWYRDDSLRRYADESTGRMVLDSDITAWPLAYHIRRYDGEELCYRTFFINGGRALAYEYTP